MPSDRLSAKSIVPDPPEADVMTGTVSPTEPNPDKDTSTQVNTVGPLVRAFDAHTASSKHGKFSPPSATYLRTRGFGQPSRHHSYCVHDKPLDNVLIFIFKSNFLADGDLRHLRQCHPLYEHLWVSLTRFRSFNF